MKIACIGNMNSFMFCLVRYLRDMGYHADLFLLEEFSHFLPEADSYNDDYKNYTFQLDWEKTGYWDLSPEKVRKDMAGYDVLIGGHYVPAFLHKAGLQLDFFVPHGSDVFGAPFYKFKNFIPKRWEIGAYLRARAQKKGIQNSRYIICDFTNEDGLETPLKKINSKAVRLMMNPPFIYIPQYTTEQFSSQKEYAGIQAVRSQYDFIVFHQSRHVWASDSVSLHYKANDRLIRAFAGHTKKHPEQKSVLILFEYGVDAPASKALVEELGITDKVIWLPQMPRKQLMMWAQIADVGVGQLGRSWISYGSVYEILAAGKPFIGYRKDELYKDHYKELYPMVSANTEELLLETFEDMYQRPEHYKQMGEQGNAWFRKYGIERVLTHMREILK